eukprot:1247594-Pyramimonas_sp.AAC.1
MAPHTAVSTMLAPSHAGRLRADAHFSLRTKACAWKSLQGFVTRKHYKERLQGIVTRNLYTESLQGNVTRNRYKTSFSPYSPVNRAST